MPSDRIQREVEDLLARLEKFPPKRPLSRRIKDAVAAPFRAAGRGLAGLHLPSISAGHLLLVAIAILVVAYVAGGGSSLWNWIIAGGIALFILAFILSLRRQSSRPTQKYWRDQPLDLKRGGGRSWLDRWRGRR